MIDIKIRIAAVGKIKEKYLLQAQDEYVKRISRFAKIEVMELADEPAPDNPSDAQVAEILKKEGERLRKAINGFSNVVVLAIEGKRETSERFAEDIKQYMDCGSPDICFVIGGSFGIDPGIKEHAKMLSISDMTLPHRLARIVILEQIFRAFKIINNEAYHK